MKLGPIFSLFVVVLSLFSLHVHAQGAVKFCPKQVTLKGTCGGVSGGYNCAIAFLGMFGASAMPMHCTCTDKNNQQRLCKCDIVCH